MRYLAVILAALLFTAAWSGAAGRSNEMPAARPVPVDTPQPQKSATDEIVQFLLTSAAKDFHEHGPAGPLRFRKVRVGHTSGENVRYVMCGQFQQTEKGDKAEWTSFVTIKTSGYEQYIGWQGDTYCKGAKWDTKDDLSASLQSQLDSLK